MENIISIVNWNKLSKEYKNAQPFSHIVIDNFFRI